MPMQNEISNLFKLKKENALALSYSRISDFDRNGPKALNKRSRVEGQGVHIGSLVDTLLLTPEEFDDLYYVYNGKAPTATLGKLTKIILDNYLKLPTTETVLQIAKKNGFWSSWLDETILEAFDTKEFWSYIKEMRRAGSCTLVTTPDLDIAENLVEILRTHKFSKDIITNELDHFNQIKFKMEYRGFVLRGILDKIVVDHTNKTVRFIDLKTGQGAISEFLSSFIKWRYYLQEAIYIKAFKTICATLGLKGYTILPFQFLYISKYEQIPLLFTVEDKWHQAAINGFQTKAGYKYRGLEQLLDEITWHTDNREFVLTKQVGESEGMIPLDDSFITVNNE